MFKLFNVLNNTIENNNEIDSDIEERRRELRNLYVSRYEKSFRNTSLAEQKDCLQALLNDINASEKKIKKLKLRK